MTMEEIYSLYRAAGAITTDSRRSTHGALFLALHGSTFDGNLFAISALEKGCSYAIIDAAKETLDPTGQYHSRLLRVEDTLSTYKALARQHRREYAIPVIAITGTNGKTTTKELSLAVLSSKYHVLATQGNYNNDIGVPQTLCALSATHDIAIIEMGASHRGDIQTLAATAEPTIGIITNIGVAHLEGFGSIAGVRAAKGELYDFLAQHGGSAFVDSNDTTLMSMAQERQIVIIPYAIGRIVDSSPYLVVALDDGTCLHTQLVGGYNLQNILAAVTIGRHFGVPMTEIATAIESYQPHNNRSQRILTADNEVIVDAYNANPSSMVAAIENFAQLSSPRRKMLILGDMAELGAASNNEHQKIVDLLTQHTFTDVWLVGSAFCGTQTHYPRFATTNDVRNKILQEQPRNRCILIKGSNVVGLASLVENL